MQAFPTRTELDDIMSRALALLFEHDEHLLAADASERSISHRLASYVQQLLPTWDVDCEYNRNGHHPKVTKLPVEETTTNDEHACTVFPDIIIHHRNGEDNLLAVEIKKSSSNISNERDHLKLGSYCRAPLRYRHALFLKLRTDNRQDKAWLTEWFSTGNA